jgi:molybdopterin synthase catalytic subunit/molybdopterin converting factor small subunit
MHVRVRLFARQRQTVGLRQVDLALPAQASIRDAWSALAERFPTLEPDGPYVRFARNGEYTDAATMLDDGDEVACIPPVAGGADMTGVPDVRHHLALTGEPISAGVLAGLRASVATAADGAIVEFIGTTRESPGTPAPGEELQAARHAGQRVLRLEYEAFDQLALKVLQEIAAEIEARFGVLRLAILHRTGAVAVGEPSVAIIVAAPHRGPAFDACRYAIEELKARAPIWKEERFADGGVWLGAPARTSVDPGVGSQ